MDRLIVAKQAAMEAGTFLRKRFHQPLVVDTKRSYDDVVSDADHGSEKIILRRIKESFPEDGILSEESGHIKEGTYTWVVDPLDGSINYVNHIPYCAVSIAIVHEQIPVIGVIYQPFSDELFWAQTKKGAWFANTRLRVEDHPLGEAIISIDFGREGKKEIFQWLQHLNTCCRYTRVNGSAAVALTELARGWIQGYLQNVLYPWDAAAGVLIAQEAGATLTNQHGKPWTIADPYLIAGSSKRTQQKLLREIRSAKE